MFTGILWAVAAGVMLGLYALPEKFTKDFEYENTWGTFFTTALFIIPLIVGFGLIDGFGEVLKAVPSDVLIKMLIASILWGVGVMLWGKAINYIGLSLGFSLFIGSLILVGTILPFIIDGFPPQKSLILILAGLAVVLVGIIFNGAAGIRRQKEEGNDTQKSSMGLGILIAVGGGLLATGFSVANTIGRPVLLEAVVAQGNPEWMVAIAVMFIIYVGGGIFVFPFFLIELTRKKLWGKFKTPEIGKNLSMTTIMAILNFAASAVFAYAALKLGAAGNSVGYAIFNTISVAVAVVGGLITREWVKASNKTRMMLYVGLAGMIVGVVLVAYGNSLA